MVLRPLIVAFICVVTVLRLAGAAAATTPDKMTGLLSNSPFGTGKTGASAAAGSGEALEFRAVLEEGGSKFFSIYETATRRSNWVEMNDPVNGFSVKTYDAAKESVTMEYQGRSLTLAIKRAPAVAQAMQQPMPSPAGANGMMPLAIPTVGPGAPSAVDQQRIQQIQEEIRRRRALRGQVGPPGNTPGAAPNYGNGPQPTPSTSPGPVPQPSNATGPQLIPPRN